MCSQQQKEFSIKPGVSWGTATAEAQLDWAVRDCDSHTLGRQQHSHLVPLSCHSNKNHRNSFECFWRSVTPVCSDWLDTRDRAFLLFYSAPAPGVRHEPPLWGGERCQGSADSLTRRWDQLALWRAALASHLFRPNSYLQRRIAAARKALRWPRKEPVVGLWLRDSSSFAGWPVSRYVDEVDALRLR